MARPRIFYGWYIVGLAALAMVGTLPGRTQGLGLITEPLLAELRLDRVTYAGVNFWATIAGAIGAVGVGRLLDRFGARAVLTTVAVGLGAIVALMSQVSTLAGLATSMTLTRAVGQSALSVVSIAMVGHWFVRRIDAAMACYSAALSIGFMVAFPLVGALIQAWGWRAAWLAIGVALAAGLAPLAWLIARRGPETMGLSPDGGAASPDPAPTGGLGAGVATERAIASEPRERSGDRGVPASERVRGSAGAEPPGSELDGHAWTAAMRTGAFWVFAAGTALYGLVASGIGLFNQSILEERGFSADVYYQTLAVTAMTGLAGNVLGGWLAARVPLTRLMAIALLVLSGGLIVLPHLESTGGVMGWAAAMGLGGGLVMVLFFSAWPKVFGRRHLGRIQGVAQGLTVLASALGPLLLAWCVELTGSYAWMFRALSAVIAATAAAALVVSMPAPVIAARSLDARASVDWR